VKAITDNQPKVDPTEEEKTQEEKKASLLQKATDKRKKLNDFFY